MTSDPPRPTARLRFRPYAEPDIDFVAALFGDAQARRFYPTMGAEASRRSWIEWNIGNYEKHGFGLWILEHAEIGIPVGDCGLTLQDVAGTTMIEVGYHIAQGHRGRGYATEAAAACIEHAIGVLDFESVCSIVDPRNLPSIAVASRVHSSRSSFERPDGKTMYLFTTRKA